MSMHHLPKLTRPLSPVLLCCRQQLDRLTTSNDSGFDSAPSATTGPAFSQAEMRYLQLLHLPKPDDRVSDEVVEALEAGIWQTVRGKDTGLRKTVQCGADNPLDAEALLQGLQPLPSSPTSGRGPPLMGGHPYGAWATTRMPKGPDSLLSLLGFDVRGVTSGLFYLALLAAAFCFHIEDSRFASYNILYAGYPKLWYVVSRRHLHRFRQACAAMGIVPSLATMADWELLILHGVKIRRIVQRPGEIVMTFPGAYHGGFNLGPNVAEAANVAFVDWLPQGRLASEDDRARARAPVVAFERVVLALAISAQLPTSPFFGDRGCVRKELQLLLEKERELRHDHGYGHKTWRWLRWWLKWVVVADTYAAPVVCGRTGACPSARRARRTASSALRSPLRSTSWTRSAAASSASSHACSRASRAMAASWSGRTRTTTGQRRRSSASGRCGAASSTPATAVVT